MSELQKCPVCGGAAEIVHDGVGTGLGSYQHRITVGEVAMSLANEDVVREVATIVPAGAKVMLAGMLLGTNTDSGDPFFNVDDVRDEAEAAARCDGIVRELRARRKFDEAAQWSLTAQRHRKRAARIALLLSDDDRAIVHQQINGNPMSEPPRSPIEVVKS